ncbi:MAG: Asp-tRNA(Asn)/Glu-tRNA(Gln) amidotransferase subunit GatA [Ruminococcaceae bacterium]|nr:Asp-tRNA(Asn)/Glu-tRNA(Gln) amidotransferase subunit GatA [Oscillospiraceae bacterium]
MQGMTLSELARALREGEISSFELTKQCLHRIHEEDTQIGAFLSVFEEDALCAAREFDTLPDRQKWCSPLAGIPTAVKDNLMTAGKRSTCGSRILADFVPPYDATVVSALKKAGAVIIGKTNMDEFGMGSTTEHSAFYITRNPLDSMRVPGGSSGGSAAAVAAGMVPFALGSDTGGSVRLPASYCGLVGLRPTYGTVSRFGLTAFCSSMDTVGPITKTAADNALVYAAIAGRDPKDATGCAFDFHIPKREEPLRVGVIAQLMGEAISDEVRNAIEEAIDVFKATGAMVKRVSLPSLCDALYAYFIISSAEASSNLARFDGVRYGYRAEDCGDLENLYRQSRDEGLGEEVKRRIRLGTYALTRENKEAYYYRALSVKDTLVSQFALAFADCDILLCPTAPDIAPKFGQMQTPTQMYCQDLCTVPMSLAALPALSIPCGKSREGLPIGMQIVGRPFSEGLLYYAGMLYEKEAGK